ncbi:uncharacterized protein EV420DRAFT_1485882 [Desarmillaria tabescens]|uniref:Uncharacterized protein n=1 Tax=Armillaria tabescens TaxID=1929756 RepID=A0AA39MNX8_ARMTA|nr:uncharacterized protein EV420DRAFT_1485882 [Desarmillaria tabescens]KAK0440674.1 hypothetical protein EV420DRAFT_1485882 [Desarmillaria tabescens]
MEPPPWCVVIAPPNLSPDPPAEHWEPGVFANKMPFLVGGKKIRRFPLSIACESLDDAVRIDDCLNPFVAAHANDPLPIFLNTLAHQEEWKNVVESLTVPGRNFWAVILGSWIGIFYNRERVEANLRAAPRAKLRRAIKFESIHMALACQLSGGEDRTGEIQELSRCSPQPYRKAKQAIPSTPETPLPLLGRGSSACLEKVMERLEIDSGNILYALPVSTINIRSTAANLSPSASSSRGKRKADVGVVLSPLLSQYVKLHHDAETKFAIECALRNCKRLEDFGDEMLLANVSKENSLTMILYTTSVLPKRNVTTSVLQTEPTPGSVALIKPYREYSLTASAMTRIEEIFGLNGGEPSPFNAGNEA